MTHQRRPKAGTRPRGPIRPPSALRARATWLGLLTAFALAIAGCGISVEDPDAAGLSVGAPSAETLVAAFPTLAHLSPDQLGDRGIDLTADPETVAAAIVDSGATEVTVGIDTTTSISSTTIRQVRAALAQSALAPFAAAMAALQAGRFDDIQAVPSLDLVVREVATGLECRATAAPWVHVTRGALPPFPPRRNNDSKQSYTARVGTWIREVAAIEQTVVDQLDTWVRGVPRRSGTSDPLCYLDAERERQLIAGIDQPETTLVTDYLVTGAIDDVEDLSGLTVDLLFECDVAGGTEDPRECDDTAATAVQTLTELGADVRPVDTSAVLAAAGSGEHPDRDVVVRRFSALSDQDVTDLLTQPIDDAFQGGL